MLWLIYGEEIPKVLVGIAIVLTGETLDGKIPNVVLVTAAGVTVTEKKTVRNHQQIIPRFINKRLVGWKDPDVLTLQLKYNKCMPFFQPFQGI